MGERMRLKIYNLLMFFLSLFIFTLLMCTYKKPAPTESSPSGEQEEEEIFLHSIAINSSGEIFIGANGKTILCSYDNGDNWTRICSVSTGYFF